MGLCYLLGLRPGKTHHLFVVREKTAQCFGNLGLTKWLGQARQVKHVVGWASIAGDQQDGQARSICAMRRDSAPPSIPGIM